MEKIRIKNKSHGFSHSASPPSPLQIVPICWLSDLFDIPFRNELQCNLANEFGDKENHHVE